MKTSDMRLSVENSHRLSNISFLCACFVVLVHTRWPLESEWQRYLVVGVRGPLAELIIPFFSTVSGFFLAGHIGEPGWWRVAVSKRVRTLLVPYVAWMAIGTVVVWLCSGVRPTGLANSGLDLSRQPMVVPLWYLRALFLLVLSSPLIHAALVRWGWRLLIVECVAAFALKTMLALGAWSETEGWGCLLNNGLSLDALFYFTLGLWQRARPSICIGRRTALVSCLLAFALVFARLLLHCYGVFCPVNVSYLAAPFFLIGIWHVMPTVPLPRDLARTSFAIYVSHAIVLMAIGNCPQLKGNCPFGVTVLLGIFIPVVLSILLSRFAPRVARILYGGRT